MLLIKLFFLAQILELISFNTLTVTFLSHCFQFIQSVLKIQASGPSQNRKKYDLKCTILMKNCCHI